MKKFFKDIQKYLLSGVSYMMPVVVAGGVILAVSLLGAQQTETGLVPANAFMQFLNALGKDGIAMMIPVFAAYICYSMAGKPGLTPGFVLGYLANNTISINNVDVKSGFLGALVLALIAGYIVKWMKGWKDRSCSRHIVLLRSWLSDFCSGKCSAQLHEQSEYHQCNRSCNVHGCLCRN